MHLVFDNGGAACKSRSKGGDHDFLASFIRPSLIASHIAVGMVADDVLAYFSTLEMTLSIGNFKSLATASMILRFAW